MVARARLTGLVVLLLLAACAAPGDNEAISFPRPGDSPGTAAAPEAQDDFFDFTATRLGGGSQVTGSELQGKDVALWFWAPW